LITFAVVIRRDRRAVVVIVPDAKRAAQFQRRPPASLLWANCRLSR
jgi:hypothetical protein